MPICILWFIGGIVAALVGNSLRVTDAYNIFGYALMIAAEIFFVIAVVNGDDIENSIIRTLYYMLSIILVAIIFVIIIFR